MGLMNGWRRWRARRRSDDRGEPGLRSTIEFDLPEEHGVGSHPQARVVVQRAVHDQWLQRFAVPRDTDDLVFATLVVTVAPKACFREWRQFGHGVGGVS